MTDKTLMTNDELDSALAASPAPRVTREGMEAKVVDCEYIRRDTLTLCVLTLENGIKLVGKSACVDPANFREDIGQKIAYEDAITQMWPLEGYLLAERHGA